MNWITSVVKFMKFMGFKASFPWALQLEKMPREVYVAVSIEQSWTSPFSLKNRGKFE
jgi:hypothetical protein